MVAFLFDSFISSINKDKIYIKMTRYDLKAESNLPLKKSSCRGGAEALVSTFKKSSSLACLASSLETVAFNWVCGCCE